MFLVQLTKKIFCSLPLASSAISAGFPSPADDHIEQALDLNEHLVKHPAATFFVRADGDSMLGAGIHPGDLLIVDRALEAREGSVIIAVVDGEFTVKRFEKRGGTIFLSPENAAYAPIEIKEGMDFEVWGVVTNAVHRMS
jgi:DNA polymerase V